MNSCPFDGQSDWADDFRRRSLVKGSLSLPYWPVDKLTKVGRWHSQLTLSWYPTFNLRCTYQARLRLQICNHLNFFKRLNEGSSEIRLTYFCCRVTFYCVLWMCHVYMFQFRFLAVCHYWCSHVIRGQLHFIRLLSEQGSLVLDEVRVERECFPDLHYISDVYFLQHTICCRFVFSLHYNCMSLLLWLQGPGSHYLIKLCCICFYSF